MKTYDVHETVVNYKANLLTEIPHIFEANSHDEILSYYKAEYPHLVFSELYNSKLNMYCIFAADNRHHNRKEYIFSIIPLPLKN